MAVLCFPLLLMPEDRNDQNPQFEIPEEEFRAAVSPPDLKGRINLRVEQALQQEIEDIAEDTRYPLRSVSEVVRFCLLDGIDRLRQWKPQPTLLGAIKASNALALRDKIQCDSLDMLQRLDERITWFIAHKHYDEAINLVAQIRSYFDGVQNDFWSQYVVKELEIRFVGWLDRIDHARSSDGGD